MDIRNLLSKGRSRSVLPEPYGASDRGNETPEGQSSTGKGKRRWSAERDSEIREPGAGVYSPIRDTSPTQQIDDPRKKARTTLEGNQEQERDEVTLVLDKIKGETIEKLYTALQQLKTGKKSQYKKNPDMQRHMNTLVNDALKVKNFKAGQLTDTQEAYASMATLLTEVPKIATGSTKITAFLRETEQIKQNNPEQAEEGQSGS